MKRQVICILMCLCVLFTPAFAFSDECNTEFKRVSDRVAIINCEKYFTFPEEKGRKLLKDAKENRSEEKKIELLEQENKILERQNERKDQTIQFLNKQFNNQVEISSKLLEEEPDKDKKIWETKEFYFTLGFIASTGTYYLWQESFKR